jgi:hypothetical protein
MYLGIEQQSGLVYAGANTGLLMPVVPVPSVTQAKLIEDQDDWNDLPSGLAQSPMSWVFREDTYAVRAAVANKTASISAEELLRGSKWALAAVDRIDPVKSAHFIRAFEIDRDMN